MAVNKRGFKQFQAKDEELNRVQQAIAEALRRISEQIGATGATGAAGPAGTNGTNGTNGTTQTAASIGTEFGTFGNYINDSRIWGVISKLDANSTTLSSYGMATPATSGNETDVPPTTGNTRAWNGYETGTSVNNIAGQRQTNPLEAMWVQRPRLWSLIRSVGSVTDRRIWVALTSLNIDQFSTDSSKRYVGARYDSAVSPNWFVCVSDGAVASETDTGIAVVADTDYHIDVDFRDASALILRVNGVATTHINDLPAGAGYFKHQVTVTTLANAAKQILWHHTMLQRR